MQAKIYCKTTENDVHEYYLEMNGERYHLFEQRFNMSNHAYFKNGVALDDIGNFKRAKSEPIRRTLEKIPKYIKKLSQDYGMSFGYDVKPHKAYSRSIKHTTLDLAA